ncbi:hypothetical protein [Thermomonospora umbrina]|nr:hypothetical protein [Thermomonospora umbrina]
MSTVFGGPVVKAAAFSYGVRKALGNRAAERPPARPEPPARRALRQASGKGRR